jgi:hypothetical protein
MKFLLGFLKHEVRGLTEDAKWEASGDYDERFWRRVRELGTRPGASPANPQFVAHLSFESELPPFVSKDVFLMQRWLKTARESYHHDLLKQFIAGAILNGPSFVSGDRKIELDRLALMAGACEQMRCYREAIGLCETALRGCPTDLDDDNAKTCRDILVRLKGKA